MQRVVAIVVAAFAVLCYGCGSTTPATPSPTTPPSVTVIWQYTLRIPQTWIADLDAGVLVNSPYAVSDVWFEAVTRTERYLTSTGARLAMSGTTAPGVSGCMAAPLTFARIPMGVLSSGLYLCGQTDEGRIVEIRVVDVPVGTTPADDPALTISVTVYN